MLNVLCSFSSISVIISSILVMIGHVREIGHMYQFAVSTSEDFEVEYYVKTGRYALVFWPLIGRC